MSRIDGDQLVTIERCRGRDELCHALEAPVRDRFGSFAGQPRISGTVTWTAANRRVLIEGRRGDGRFRGAHVSRQAVRAQPRRLRFVAVRGSPTGCPYVKGRSAKQAPGLPCSSSREGADVSSRRWSRQGCLGGAGVARPSRLALGRACIFCCADTDGLLTAERVIDPACPLQAVHWVYMCRPQGIRKLWSDVGLRGNRWPRSRVGLGVPRRQVSRPGGALEGSPSRTPMAQLRRRYSRNRSAS